MNSACLFWLVLFYCVAFTDKLISFWVIDASELQSLLLR